MGRGTGRLDGSPQAEGPLTAGQRRGGGRTRKGAPSTWSARRGGGHQRAHLPRLRRGGPGRWGVPRSTRLSRRRRRAAAGGPLSPRFPSADGGRRGPAVRPRGASPVGMFQVGRSGVPRPAPRSLDDLDSVQRVLLHRSVLRRVGDGRGACVPGVPGALRGAALAREGRGPVQSPTLCGRGVSRLGVWPHAGPARSPPPEKHHLLQRRKND